VNSRNGSAMMTAP